MNIYIGEPVVVSDMQGPCPDGFHVPTSTEWESVKTIWTSLGGGGSDGTGFSTILKLPLSGAIEWNSGNISAQGSYGYYWSSSPYGSSKPTYSLYLLIGASYILPTYDNPRSSGHSIRPFKNSSVIPTSSWTKLYGTSIESGGIFWNSIKGLISLSSNGSTWVTIADKNLGATTVWESGNTLSQNNCGYYYQRGNNYGFPFTGATSTSSTKVNAQNYGPGNYYSGGTFIKGNNDWSSVQNDNLRGGVSQGTSTKTQEVQNIYIGEYNPYQGEMIAYKINADSSGNLYVPTGGLSSSGDRSFTYSWKVSVDGGTETTYTGTPSYQGKITLSGYTSGTSHIITITPTTEEYGWARAYAWCPGVPGVTNVTEIVYDGSYMGYAISATNTGNFFRAYLYNYCTSLIAPADEYLPDTVTTIGNNFRESEYYKCSSLTYASEESLPGSVTSIGTYFRQYQYEVCTSLTEIKGWKDLSIGHYAGYRKDQYYASSANKTVKVLSDVGYSAESNDVLQNAYVTSVSVPSAYLTNFKNTSKYPWVGITDSKFIGY